MLQNEIYNILLERGNHMLKKRAKNKTKRLLIRKYFRNRNYSIDTIQTITCNLFWS